MFELDQSFLKQIEETSTEERSTEDGLDIFRKGQMKRKWSALACPSSVEDSQSTRMKSYNKRTRKSLEKRQKTLRSFKFNPLSSASSDSVAIASDESLDEAMKHGIYLLGNPLNMTSLL
jgi:DNA replication protein DnaC